MGKIFPSRINLICNWSNPIIANKHKLMAEIQIFCLHCGQHISCDEGYRGTQISCPTCNQSFLVPQAQKSAIALPTPLPPRSEPASEVKRRQRPNYLSEAKEWEGAGDVPEGWEAGQGNSADSVSIPDSRKSGMAIRSMVLGILSLTCLGFLAGIPAIILGHIAYGRTQKRPDKYSGLGMAIAGFVMGYISLVYSLVLAAMLLPALSSAKEKAQIISSENNLKQIGLSFLLWAGDHNDQFPFNVSQAQGGTRELSDSDSNGFEKNIAPIFMVMSNELGTTRVLVCPNDEVKQAAPDFASLTANSISYQLRTGTDINQNHPKEVLAVDAINGIVLYCDGTVVRDLNYKKKRR